MNPLRPHSLRALAQLLRTHRSRRRYSSSPAYTSVDANEVKHFNALASTWWDPHGPSRLLHLMNSLRHDFIRSCHASQSSPAPTSNLRYLDVGCGGGIFAESAARLPSTGCVTALDPSTEVLAVAKAHARRDPVLMQPGRLKYLNHSIEDLAAPGDAEKDGYDVVTLFEVLEHVSRPSEFLAQLLPHVKPGGWLVLSTIARTWTSWLTTKVVAEDVLRIVPRGTHDWGKYINEEEVREWFETKNGWEGARAMGVMYVPGLGWRQVRGGEGWGNFFFGIRRSIKG